MYNIYIILRKWLGELRMDIKKKLIAEESKILDDKINLMKNELYKNDNIIKSYPLQDINTYKKINKSEYFKAINQQKNLESAMENPYFGRLDIEYKEDNEKETVYIGRRRVDIGDDIIVYSWAAPIADIYQEYNSGEYKHKYVDKNSGKEIFLEGNILEKRKISISKSKVIDVYSYTNITEKDEEEFVRDKIENSKTDKLGVIIETVQKEQNRIIRLPIEKNIIVQGCAGSGKSSVAFHRLAYLAYNYNLKDNELLVISPNKIFQGYTSNILMELGADFNVQQYTFKEFAEVILKRKIENNIINNDEIYKEQSILKTSKRFKLVLDNYINYLEDNFIPKDNIVVDDFTLIDSNQVNSIWCNQFGTYKINDRIDKFKVYLENYLKDRLEEYIKSVEKSYASNMNILTKYNNSPVIYNEILKLTREEQEIRIKRLEKQCIAIINGYISNFKKIDVVEKYKELLRDKDLLNSMSKLIIYKTKIDIIISNTTDNIINDIDCIPIMYLYYKINENKNKYRHIVVDECQDLSYIEIAVIEGLTQSFSLVGDFNQRININKCTASLEEINDMFKKYTFFESYCLNKSFRNSMSITNYSNAILDEYFINKESIPVAFNRETAKPKVYSKIGRNQTIKAIAENINSKSSENKNIAVILKTEASAKKYYTELSKVLNNKSINLIDNEYCKYKKGINILSASLSKGLEFDYVIIVNANEFENNEEDRRLLYIAATRALHELEIYTESKECFITSIDKNLWESKFRLSIDPINEALRITIIKTLTDGFGKLPQEYIDYVYNMDSLSELSRFVGKLEGVEDIDKLFKEEGIVIVQKTIEVYESEKTLNEASVTLETEGEIGHLDKLIYEIKGRGKFVTGKQLEVFNYIVNNINELPKFKSCKELADKLEVSTSTISTTLLRLRMGSFWEFISKVRECIKKDRKK